MEQITAINLGYGLGTKDWQDEACRAVMALEHDGAISVFGHGVDDQLRMRMVDVISHVYRASTEVQQQFVRPDLFYQVGLTPPNTETHRQHEGWDLLPKQHRPLTNFDGKDEHKYRWFDPIGPVDVIPYKPVTPDIPGFRQSMVRWGEALAYTVVKDRLAKMIAFGYGLPVDYFEEILARGAHLVAPTGTELGRCLEMLAEEEVPFIKLAGFHNDLNWGTIHGRATIPGLWIWTTEGKRVLVRIKEGHLLFQVGQQLAAQTAYRMKAGYHEVVITPKLGKEIQAKHQGQTFAWRIGSTVFVTADRQASLVPDEKLFAGLDREALILSYPHLSMRVDEQMQDEFSKISFA